MTKEEFEKSLVRRGYCSTKRAEEYTEKHPKEEYEESDFEDAYRALNPETMRREAVKIRCHDEENTFRWAWPMRSKRP